MHDDHVSDVLVYVGTWLEIYIVSLFVICGLWAVGTMVYDHDDETRCRCRSPGLFRMGWVS